MYHVIYSFNRTLSDYYMLGPMLYRRGYSGEKKGNGVVLTVFPVWKF